MASYLEPRAPATGTKGPATGTGPLLIAQSPVQLHSFLLRLRSQGPPTEVKIGKSGKWHFWGQKMSFWGSPLEPFKWGLFGAFNSSLNSKSLLREGIKCPKSPFKWFQGGPPKRHVLTPKMSFSRFSNFDLCRGTLGSQSYGFNWDLWERPSLWVFAGPNQ